MKEFFSYTFFGAGALTSAIGARQVYEKGLEDGTSGVTEIEDIDLLLSDPVGIFFAGIVLLAVSRNLAR